MADTPRLDALRDHDIAQCDAGDHEPQWCECVRRAAELAAARRMQEACARKCGDPDDVYGPCGCAAAIRALSPEDVLKRP